MDEIDDDERILDKFAGAHSAIEDSIDAAEEADGVPYRKYLKIRVRKVAGSFFLH